MALAMPPQPAALTPFPSPGGSGEGGEGVPGTVKTALTSLRFNIAKEYYAMPATLRAFFIAAAVVAQA